MIPARIMVTGDIPRGRRWEGYARSRLTILEDSMKSQGLKQLMERTKPIEGIVVDCVVTFALKTIRIHAFPVVPLTRPLAEPEEEPGYECLSLPCFAAAKIITVRTTATDQQYADGLRFVYDVEVCLETKYLLFEGLEFKASAWEEYYVDQFVIASLDVRYEADGVPSCCSDPAGIFKDLTDTSKLIPDIYALYPIYIQGKMKKWYLK